MRAILAGLIVLAVWACADGTAPDPATPAYAIVNAYQLRTWNGKLLPAVIATGVPGQSATLKTEVSDGGVSISDSGTWTRFQTMKVTWVGDSVTYYTTSDAGTYTLVGSALTLNKSVGIRFPAQVTLVGDSLTYQPTIDSPPYSVLGLERQVYVR